MYLGVIHTKTDYINVSRCYSYENIDYINVSRCYSYESIDDINVSSCYSYESIDYINVTRCYSYENIDDINVARCYLYKSNVDQKPQAAPCLYSAREYLTQKPCDCLKKLLVTVSM